MYEIREEDGPEVLAECIDLSRLQYEELEGESDVLPFNPDRALLEELRKMGLMTIVTVRDAGELVGYIINTVSTSLFTSKLESKELAIFLDKRARGGSTFLRMVKLMESLMEQAGVVAQYIAFREDHDRGMAEKLGYIKVETVYRKVARG